MDPKCVHVYRRRRPRRASSDARFLDLRLEARHGVELDGELGHRGATSVDGSRKAERSALRECWRKRSDA